MGLNFCIQKVEHTDVGFSYGEFNDFRHRIARSVGLDNVYSGTVTDMYLCKQYTKIESTHPMYPLIDHDDNDGELGPDDCGQVGRYLKHNILPEWRKELEEKPNDELANDIEQGDKLAELMLECYENDNTLLFI